MCGNSNTHGGSVSQLVLLPRQDLAQNTPHDFARARLGQIVDDEDCFGCGKWPDRLSHLKNQVFPDLIARFVAVLEGDEGIDGLAGKLVANTYNSCFGDLV